MLVEYFTFDNGQELHSVEIDLKHELEHYNTVAGINELNKQVSQVIGKPVGCFKIGNIR
ncbi:MAG: hypothetical protein ABTA23_07950 [Solibacillus sp.]